MKTAQKWLDYWQAAPETDLTGFLTKVQLDARAGVAIEISALLHQFQGYEIVRSLARTIALRYGLPAPYELFRVEHLHPPKATASVSEPGSSAPPSPQTPTLLPSPQSPPPQSGASGPTAKGSPAPFSAGSLPPKSELPTEVRVDLHSVDLKLQHDRIEALEKHLALHVQPPDLDRLTFLERLVTSTHAQLRALQAQCFERLEKLEKAQIETERRFRVATEWLANLEQWKEGFSKPPPAPPDALPTSDSLVARLEELEKFQSASEIWKGYLRPRVEALEKWKADVAQDLENLDRLLQAHLKLHSQAEYPKAQAVQPEQVVGLRAGQEVDEVRFLTVKWQGDHWLMLRDSPCP